MVINYRCIVAHISNQRKQVVIEIVNYCEEISGSIERNNKQRRIV